MLLYRSTFKVIIDNICSLSQHVVQLGVKSLNSDIWDDDEELLSLPEPKTRAAKQKLHGGTNHVPLLTLVDLQHIDRSSEMLQNFRLLSSRLSQQHPCNHSSHYPLPSRRSNLLTTRKRMTVSTSLRTLRRVRIVMTTWTLYNLPRPLLLR